MNFFHLIAIGLLALNFTGKPLPEKALVPVDEKVILAPELETEEFISWTSDRLLTCEDFK